MMITSKEDYSEIFAEAFKRLEIRPYKDRSILYILSLVLMGVYHGFKGRDLEINFFKTLRSQNRDFFDTFKSGMGLLAEAREFEF